jgi:hypothetical protein
LTGGWERGLKQLSCECSRQTAWFTCDPRINSALMARQTTSGVSSYCPDCVIPAWVLQRISGARPGDRDSGYGRSRAGASRFQVMALYPGGHGKQLLDPLSGGMQFSRISAAG